MGVRILKDRYDDLAVLFCSTSEWAFGPVFYKNAERNYSASELAKKFLSWLGRDPREYTDDKLRTKYLEFGMLEWKQCSQCFDTLIPATLVLCNTCKEETLERLVEQSNHNHINPNCKDSTKCKPHGEEGPVEYDEDCKGVCDEEDR